MQNVIDCTHTTSSTAGFRIANDNALGNITHSVNCYNTYTGYGSVNRSNNLYDEATVARFHKFELDVGNVYGQLNTKGDVFTADATRLGQFTYAHGVGCRGNFSQFQTNSGAFASEMQTYPGMRCNIGTSSTVRNDPLFVNYQGTGGSGGVPSAGAGGSNLRLQAGSPARGIVTDPVLRFGLDGVARAASNDAAGAYA